MAPDLYFEEKGSHDSHPLIFLHGLLGSSRNWRSVAKILSSDFRTLCFDLPNHGKSFQMEKLTVQEMADLIHQEILKKGILCTKGPETIVLVTKSCVFSLFRLCRWQARIF